MQNARPLTVYIIDDDPEYHELYRRYLEGFPEWKFNIIFQSDPELSPEETVRHAPELIFLDYVLGGRTGLDVLTQIRVRNQDSAVIVFTGQGDERMAAEIIKAGADDYVPKTDLTPDVLRLSVARALDRFKLRAARKESETEREERDRFNALRANIWKLAARTDLSQEDTIQQILGLAGPALQVSRACYNRRAGGNMTCVQEWCDENAKPSIGSSAPESLAKYFVKDVFFTINRDSVLSSAPLMTRSALEKILNLFEHTLNIESVASVPLLLDGVTQGALSFDICHDRKPKPAWTDQRKALVTELAQIVGQILARKRVEEARAKAEKEIAEQNRFNALRAEIWQIAADKTLDEAELTQRLLEALGPALGLSRAVYLRRDEKDDALVCTLDWCVPGLASAAGKRLAPAFWRRARAEELSVFEPSKVPAAIRAPLLSFLKVSGIQTYLSVLHGEPSKVLGFFAFIQNDYLRKWSGLEINILMEMIKIFQNRSLQIKAAEEAARLNRIDALRAEIWRIAAEKTENRDLIIQKILDILGPGLGLSRAVYHVFEQSSGDCVVKLEWRAEGLAPVLGERMPSFVIQRSLKKTKTFAEVVITSDDHLNRPARAMLRAILKHFGVRAYVAVPLGRASELDGFFAFVQNDRERTWLQNELSLFLEVSKLFTLKADQVRAEQDIAEQNRFNALRAEIWKIAADGSLNRDGRIRRLLAAAGSGLALSRAGFHCREPGTDDFVLALEWVAEGLRPAEAGVRVPAPLWRKVKRREPMTQALEGVPALLRPVFRKKLRGFGIRACVLIPCFVGPEPYGNFSFIQDDYERQWKAREIEILSEIVNIAMSRLERLETEQAVAEQNRFNALRAEIWQITADQSLVESEMIQKILDVLGPFFNLGNALFIKNVASEGYFVVLNEWRKEGSYTFLSTKVPLLLVRPFLGRPHFSSDSVKIPAAVSVPLRGLLKVQGVGSFLVVSIGDPGGPEGFFAFVEKDHPRQWTHFEIDILTEIAKILLSSMRQLDAEREKEELREKLLAFQKR